MKKTDISINTRGEKEDFLKPWEKSIGACHAYTLLREDVRQHFKMIHSDCGMETIRCHGLFNDDMQVVKRNYKGELEFSFFNIDNIYDWLLSIGMKPFIELSFMPECLASDPTKTVFHYKGIVSLPKDMNEWDELIKAFVSHIEERYGKEEVRKWYFEVWNEPNLGGDIMNFQTGFFAGTESQYFDLYSHTAKAIKSIDDKLMVGGPATSNNRWVKDFVSFCKDNQVPVDFVSTHHYPTDVIFGDNPIATKEMLEIQKDLNESEDKEKATQRLYAFKENIWHYVPRGVCYSMECKAKEEAGDLPLFYTEWQSLAGSYSDGAFGASFNTKSAMDSRNLVAGYSYWCGSDVFEEGGQPSIEFCGAFGLVTYHGIRKAPFNAFQILHMMNGRILKKNWNEDTLDAYYVEDTNTDYFLLINHNSLSHPIDDCRGTVILQGYEKKIKEIDCYLVDEEHSNAQRLYREKFNEKPYLSLDEIKYLKYHSSLYHKKVYSFSRKDGNTSIKYSLAKYGTLLFAIKHR